MDMIIDQLYIPDQNKFKPEPQTGNIEYKYRLDRKTDQQLNKMVSQVIWRMNEGKNITGKYEAHYIIGLMDNGKFSSITQKELIDQISIFNIIADRAGAQITRDKIYTYPGDRCICHLVVHKKNNTRIIPELNCCLYGSGQSGKSSLMSCLIHDQQDDGNGFSRKLVLLHDHEKLTGVTSSLKYDMIGFNQNKMINYSVGLEFDQEDIYRESDRLVNLIDLPGDPRYMKTILHGLLSTRLDIILLCIPADNYPDKSNIAFYKMALQICNIQNIKPVILLTRADLITETEPVNQKLFDILSVSNQDIQVIPISSVDQTGFDKLINLLANHDQTNQCSQSNQTNQDLIFVCNEVIDLIDVTKIFHGQVIQGKLSVGDPVIMYAHGKIINRTIKTIHRKKTSVHTLYAGCTGSFTVQGSTGNNQDKTTLIIADNRINNNIIPDKLFQQKCRFSYLDNSENLKNTKNTKNTKYMMHTLNQILMVMVDKENNIIHADQSNSIIILMDNQLAVLRDDNGNIFLIKLVSCAILQVC